MNIVKRILRFALISVLIYPLIALGLILSDWPKTTPSGAGGLDFTRQLEGAVARDVVAVPVAMRDGAALASYAYPSETDDAPLLVLVHGSGWHGLQFDALARQVQAVADVLVPDLRGHGFAPIKRGDISHISQLEEDLADLIAAKRKPGQKVVLAGHSSGAGLVVRFAGGDYGDRIDAAILIAPYLQYNAPMTRPNSGGWANPLTRRIIGLSMLNGVGITALNGLAAITFNFPDAVLNGPLGDTATQAYSFRLNTGFAPRSDYLADVAKLPEFLLLVGDQDEAFVAEGYEPLMAAVTDKGRYVIVKGASHLAVVDAAASQTEITDFIGKIAIR